MIAYCRRWENPDNEWHTFEMKEEGQARPTVTGYGSRIKTEYMVKIQGRWRRVYAACYGNGATHYIGKPGAWQWIVEAMAK